MPRMPLDPYSAGESGERYNRLTPATDSEVWEVLGMMAAASEPYDDEFFGQLGRMRRALERFDSAARRLAAGEDSIEVRNDLVSGEYVSNDARAKLEEVAPERTRARGQALIQAAAGLRPFDFSGETRSPRSLRSSRSKKPNFESFESFEHPWTFWKPWPSQASEASAAATAELRKIADGPVADLLPASWLQASAAHTRIMPELIEVDPATADPETLRRHPTVDGGYSPAGTPFARMNTGSPDTAYLRAQVWINTLESTRTRLVLHEICHRMEDAVPGLIEHEREHHRHRMPGAWDGETREPISELNHENYAPEASPPFFDTYLKTRYTPEMHAIEAYEILSMSLENLFFGLRPGLPTELSEDPDTERFVLSLLLGSRSR